MANGLELYGYLKLILYMLNPDLYDRTYTAEVIRCKASPSEIVKIVTGLTIEEQYENRTNEVNGAIVRLTHCYLATSKDYHRYAKVIHLADGTRLEVPRRKRLRGKDVNLYDVLLASSGKHVVIAVPFHDLAKDFFLRFHNDLVAMSAEYEKVDITKMVIKLGETGAGRTLLQRGPIKVGLSVSRCHLVYTEQENRRIDLQQVTMAGSDIGVSKEYKLLMGPVLKPEKAKITVSPVVLGFALTENGVKKCSAITDRHGNFKIWIAPGLRRLVRLFNLLSTLDEMEDVTSTTGNVPIMQSEKIRHADEL